MHRRGQVQGHTRAHKHIPATNTHHKPRDHTVSKRHGTEPRHTRCRVEGNLVLTQETKGEGKTPKGGTRGPRHLEVGPLCYHSGAGRFGGGTCSWDDGRTKGPNLDTWRDGGREAGWAGGSGGGSVWVMPSVDVYENFLKRSQAVAGRRRRWAPPEHFLAKKCEGYGSTLTSRLGHGFALVRGIFFGYY